MEWHILQLIHITKNDVTYSILKRRLNSRVLTFSLNTSWINRLVASSCSSLTQSCLWNQEDSGLAGFWLLLEHRETDQGSVSSNHHDTNPLGRKLEAHQGHAGVSSTRGSHAGWWIQVSALNLDKLLLLRKSPEKAQCQGTQACQDCLCQYTDVSLGFTHCSFPCSSYSHLITHHYASLFLG